jgi:hypothetical protein
LPSKASRYLASLSVPVSEIRAWLYPLNITRSVCFKY